MKTVNVISFLLYALLGFALSVGGITVTDNFLLFMAIMLIVGAIDINCFLGAKNVY